MPTRTVRLCNGAEALVDEEDFEKVNRFSWKQDRLGYAQSSYKINRRQYSIVMHRLVMDAPKGICVDHIDHNKLNNTKANLRFATNSQNQANRRVIRTASGRKGVTLHKGGRWQAQVKKDGKSYYLGLHDTKEEAAAAYAEGAKRLFGEYAYLGPAA